MGINLRRLKEFIKKEKFLVIVSLVFITFQFIISFILWHRQGDLPPGYADSLVYIFGIEKVIRYHTLFPFIPTLGFSEHFNYIGYNFLMGSLGIATHLSGQQIFYYSFFFGKFAMLISLIYFLKKLFPEENILVIVSIFLLAFFFGDFDTHGFFWVVPSFLMLLIFFVLLGFILGKNKLANLPIFLLTFFYITVHPISSYSTIIFIFFTFFSYFFIKDKFRRSLKVTWLLILSVVLFQFIIFTTSKYSPLFYRPYVDTSIIKNREGRSVESGSNLSQINFAIFSNFKKNNFNADNKIANPAPSISFKLFQNQIEGTIIRISKYFPSAIGLWNSYFGWFYRIPVLLPILLASFYVNYRKKRYALLFIYLSCLFFTLGCLINPFGERSIIFLFPVTIILIATGIADGYFILNRFLGERYSSILVKGAYMFLILLGTGGFAAFALASASFYAQKTDYKTNTEPCESFLKSGNINNEYIYFYSVEGMDYFRWKNFEKYKLIGANLYDDSEEVKKTMKKYL